MEDLTNIKVKDMTQQEKALLFGDKEEGEGIPCNDLHLAFTHSAVVAILMARYFNLPFFKYELIGFMEKFADEIGFVISGKTVDTIFESAYKSVGNMMNDIEE